MKNCSTLLFFILLSLFLYACGSSDSGLLPFNSVTDDPVIGDPLDLHFSPPAASRSLSRSLTPKDLIYVELSDDPSLWRLRHTPLTDGDNSLTINKGGQYAFGFAAENPPEATTVTVSSRWGRSIAGALSCLGNFKIVAGNLDSLPLAADASDSINLGSLTEGDGSFESSLSKDQFAQESGYDTEVLTSYGTFDLANRLLMNPDIDGDGEYDHDRGYRWRFSSMVDIPNVAASDIDLDNTSNPVLDPDRFRTEVLGNLSLSYVVWLDGFSVDTASFDDLSELVLTYDDPVGTSTFSMYPSHAHQEGSDWSQIYFDPVNREDYFLPGNYTLSVPGMEELLFQNISFLTPESNYDGFIFPIAEVTADSTGRLQTLSWRWLQILDGQFVDVPSPEAVKLVITDMYWYFWRNGESLALRASHLDRESRYYENGTINIAPFGLTMGPEDDVNYGYLRTDFWDRGDNNYGFG